MDKEDGQEADVAGHQTVAKEVTKVQTEATILEEKKEIIHVTVTADPVSIDSQQELSGNSSTVGGRSEGSADSGKIVCFNELVEALDTETGAKTYTPLPAPSTTSIDESLLSEIFSSAGQPFMRAESAAATSMGSSESKVDGGSQVQVAESRESAGKKVSFHLPNTGDVGKS